MTQSLGRHNKWEAHQTSDQLQQNHHPKPPGFGHGGIILVPNLRSALDSFVVKTQNYLACNEASLLLQCIITEKQ